MARFPTTDLAALPDPGRPYDLAESIGPDLRLHDVLGSDDIVLGYGPAVGDPRLRAVIAEQHGVQPEDVIVTVGGMHALFLLAFVLCDRGDEAVTTAPLFPLARNALEAVGASIQTVKLSFDQRYRLDPAAFSAVLTPRTKLVSLASPQNPSGTTIPVDSIRAIHGVMQRICPKATLLIDETYRQAVYGDRSPVPSAVGLGAGVVSIASLSKSHGAPGVRIGWVITRDHDLREQLIAAKFSTVISCSSVDEALAIRVLARDRKTRRDHFAAGLARTAEWAGRNADLIEWIRPDAGAICCVRLRPNRFDDAAVSRFHNALEVERVRVANGTWFGDEARIFRLGFGLLPMHDLEAALAGLSAALQKAMTT